MTRNDRSSDHGNIITDADEGKERIFLVQFSHEEEEKEGIRINVSD